MKVLVTGGTGFVGSHTVVAVQQAGHHVRLLVRSPDRAAAALAPLGAGDVETILGDVTDAESVRSALEGCDSVIHAASVYTLDPRRDREVERTNVWGTKLVLSTAADMGLDPVVHVSSFTALLSERHAVIDADSPPTNPPGAYLRSKADSDRVARRLQELGAPVTVAYPGAVWGPHDPHLGESCMLAIKVLKGRLRLSFDGGFPISDVRDVARLHAALLTPGRGQRRYLAPARPVGLQELTIRLASLTGRRLPTTLLPARLVLNSMRGFHALRWLVPFRPPFDFQATYVSYIDPGWDDAHTREEFGIKPHDIDETLGDTLRWLHEQGHVADRLVGGIAGRTT